MSHCPMVMPLAFSFISKQHKNRSRSSRLQFPCGSNSFSRLQSYRRCPLQTLALLGIRSSELDDIASKPAEKHSRTCQRRDKFLGNSQDEISSLAVLRMRIFNLLKERASASNAKKKFRKKSPNFSWSAGVWGQRGLANPESGGCD